MAKTQQHRQAAVGTPLGEDVLLLVGMRGSEQLGRPFEFHLDLASENPQIKFTEIVGQNVTVRLDQSGGAIRYFNGYVSHFTQVSSDREGARYSATLVPWLWFLTRTADCRIFQAMTVPDIVKQVFRDGGFSDFEDALTETYRTWEYCVQYRETAFQFVSRLLEQEGIYYFFRHENGRHVLVLADSPSAHKPCPGYEKISCQFSGRPVSEQEYISEWLVETRLQPGSCSLNAFDFKNTKKNLQTRASIPREHTAADFDIYDYSVDYTEAKDGESYARRRVEELHSQYEVATAIANARGLHTGGTFSLIDHPRNDQNREWLITGASDTISQADFSSGGTENECVYSCSLTAIGSSEPFRPARVTPRPTIPGPQTALVVGPSGEEIYVDEHGRVKVQFHWDRYGKADENSSCWIRVAQVWAGRQWGAIYTPRVGQEVIVEFLEGDPDHPIITGRVYNGQAVPPYDLPANKTISTLKSNTTKGGAGFNEIRFEDKKGEEQIFIHAQKSEDIRVKSDCREWIGNERHLIVKKDQLEQVEGDKHSTVKGDHLTHIDGDRGLTVKGDDLTQVSGGEHLTVSGDRSESTGGDQNLDVSMNLNTKVGMKLSVEAGMEHHEKVGMNYALEAGMAVHIKGGMTVVVEGGAQLSLKVGGNFIDINPAGVFIQGTMVLINSGGAAGSGSGSSPTAPAAPQPADPPKLPKEAATAESGKVDEAPKAPEPPKATKFSPQATTLKSAAQDGTPFCEECEKAKKKQQQQGTNEASKDAKSCPSKVVFQEDGTEYGWDDKTDANVPWKSVEKGNGDTVQTEITPADKATAAEFASSDTSKATSSPAQASSDKQVVTVTGVDKGEAEVKSTCGGGDLGKMKVATYVKKTKTVAVRLVHEKNYESTDIKDADIKARLKKVYKQAVFEFTLTRLPAKTVEFDLNGDGKIDVNSWMSDEMKAIRDACKDDSYDHNLFIVSKPTDNSFGFMSFNQRYGFIHADQTSTPLKTVAHELGHGAFGLQHPAGDADNVMTQGEGDNMWRLRKNQWDKINP